MLLTDPQAPAGPSVDWRIDDIGEDHGAPVAWYTTGDGTAGTHQFEDLEQLLLVKRAGNGSARSGRLFDRFKRNSNNGQHAVDGEPDDAAADELAAAMDFSGPSPMAAPGTLNHPVVPDSAADIDPARAPLELCAPTVSAQDAVAALGADHPELPPNLPWKYHDDGAHLNLDLVAAPDEYQRGLVYLLAALLGAQPVERHREPADGYATLSVTGAYEGARIAVEATVTPDPAEGLDRIYQALKDRAPTGRIPELDDPTALPPAGAA
jgi:hypothetical protein